MTIDFTPDAPPATNNIDFTPDAAPQAQASAPNTAMNLGKAAGVGATQAVGGQINALGGLMPYLGVPSPASGAQQAVQSVGQSLIQNAPSDFNLQNPSATQSLISGGIHYAPDAYAAGSTLMGLGRLAGAGANALSDFMSGSGIQNDINAAHNTVLNGNNPAELNSTNFKNVVNDYEDLKDSATSAYTEFNNNVANRNYATSGTPPIAGLDADTGEKWIQPNSVNGTIINPASGSPEEDTFNSLTKVLQSKINTFNSAPSYANGQDLQSALGREAADSVSGQDISADDRNNASLLKNAQSALQQDIIGTFNKNGDTDLATNYSRLSNSYANTVGQYMDSPLWSAIRNNTAPPNMLNKLKIDNPQMDYIRGRLSMDPDTRNPVLAQAMTPATTTSLGGASVVNNAQGYINKLSNLPMQLRQFSNPDLENQLGAIQGNIAFRNRILSSAKRSGMAAVASHMDLGHLGEVE